MRNNKCTPLSLVLLSHPLAPSRAAAGDDDDRLSTALSQLASEVSALDPNEISALSLTARESGSLTRICELLSTPHSSSALAILANLTTAEVNPRANDAKAVLKATSSIEHVVRHLFSEYVQTAALACAICQNVVVNDAEVVTLLQERGGVGRLRQLATCEVAAIASAANGCLANLTNFWAAAGRVAHQTAPRAWHRAAIKLQFQYIRHMTHLQVKYIRHQRRKSKAQVQAVQAEAAAMSEEREKAAVALEEAMAERDAAKAAAAEAVKRADEKVLIAQKERDAALASADEMEKRLRGMALMASAAQSTTSSGHGTPLQSGNSTPRSTHHGCATGRESP